jgi:DNA repair photolyase
VAELTKAGIRTGVLVAPLMPGVNDEPEQVRPILEMAADAGAAYVTGIALHLRGEVRQLWFDWLEEHRPDLVERYRELYRRGAYAPPAERRRLSDLVSTEFPAASGRRTIFERGRRVDPAGETGHSTAEAERVDTDDDHRTFSQAQETLF